MKPSELIEDAIKAFPDDKWLVEALTNASGSFDESIDLNVCIDSDLIKLSVISGIVEYRSLSEPICHYVFKKE